MRQLFMSKFTYSYALFLCFILSFTGLNLASAQEKWALSVNKEGIQVYTRPIENSKIKAIKVVTSVPASSSQLLAAILDIQTCGDWVYHSKENVMIKQISPLDLIYYSLVDVPWPAEDRDYVVHIQAEQDPQTKVITVNSPCIPGYVDEKKNIVRISHSVGKWTITPVSKNQVRAEYVLEVDPMGNIPAWLINLFATKGPLETFRNLKVHVQKEAYKRARFKLISD